ncbi:MAG: MFS transporter [Pseudomonadota bacterium]
MSMVAGYKNAIVLALVAVPMTGGSVFMVILAGIVGASLAPHGSLSTLPLSLVVVATALSTIPATWIMSRVGRKKGFFLAVAIGVLSALLGSYAISQSNFLVFCLASSGIGAKLAFVQQFRFAAAESVDISRSGTAISVVLLGSIGGAFVGPAIANQTWFASPVEHQGSFILLAYSYLVVVFLLFFYKDSLAQNVPGKTNSPPLPISSLFSRPMIVIAILAGIVGQATMAFVMTATPLSMHVMNDFSLQETASVIRSHVIAMYLPALVTGVLVDKLGARLIISIGVVANLLTLVIGLQGHAYLHYWWALVLLGVGWNFMFVGGTTLLVKSITDSEKFKAQSINEFLVFGVSAFASLLAGSIVHWYGWSMILFASVPGLLIMLFVLVFVYKKNDQVTAAI